MKVRFLGLSLNSGDGVSLDGFMQYMESQNDASIDFNDYKRFCYIKNIKNKESPKDKKE